MKIKIKTVKNGLIAECDNEIKVYENKSETNPAIFNLLKDFGYKAAYEGYTEAAKDLSPIKDYIEIEIIVKSKAV